MQKTANQLKYKFGLFLLSKLYLALIQAFIFHLVGVCFQFHLTLYKSRKSMSKYVQFAFGEA